MKQAPDSVRSDEIFSKAALCRRLGIGRHTLTRARREGLGPWILLGRCVFIRGVDVLRYFDALAERQEGADQ